MAIKMGREGGKRGEDIYAIVCVGRGGGVGGTKGNVVNHKEIAIK